MLVKRLVPLDALRGLIMIVMALDHANLFIAHGHSRPEMWTGPFPTYSDPVVFLTRAITHLAAPGFFTLMGAGLVLFANARTGIGWTRGAVVRYLVIRGALLIVLQLFVEDPAWIWGTGGPLTVLAAPIYLGVLFGLGGAMMLGALLLWADTRVLLGLSVVLIAGTEVVIRYLVPVVMPLAPVTAWLVLPDGAPRFDVLYPILPWLGVTSFGMALGRWFVQDPERTYRRALYVGVAFLVVFVPLRALNGFGNIRPEVGVGWIGFSNVVKYPPSIAFLLLTLGIDLTLLFVLSRRVLSALQHPLSPLLVFGATPLFFYLVHLYLYGFIGRTLFPFGMPIPAMYPWWVLGLIVLYPLCWLHRRFQNSRSPNSVWRLL